MRTQVELSYPSRSRGNFTSSTFEQFTQQEADEFTAPSAGPSLQGTQKSGYVFKFCPSKPLEDEQFTKQGPEDITAPLAGSC